MPIIKLRPTTGMQCAATGCKSLYFSAFETDSNFASCEISGRYCGLFAFTNAFTNGPASRESHLTH